MLDCSTLLMKKPYPSPLKISILIEPCVAVISPLWLCNLYLPPVFLRLC
jgi:hypothetical protein